MFNRTVMIILLMATLGCLGGHDDAVDSQDTFAIPRIRFPIVYRTPPESHYLYPVSDSMQNSSAIYAGKFKFSDSISLSSYNDSLLTSDEIDFSVLDRYKDSMTSDGLEVIADYKTTVIDTSSPQPEQQLSGNTYYPVFIVNESSSNKLFNAVSAKVHAVQEAKDSNGVWRPIESAPELDWCGNSYWGLVIHPKEFVTILMAKYGGSYKTQLRIRTRIGNCMYVSAPFEGNINYNKFYMKWWSYDHAYLVADEVSTIVNKFYGSRVLYNRDSKKERAYRALAKKGKRK